MPELNWSRALLIAILALGLFFGANYYYQDHFKKTPFLDRICRLEAVASAEIIPESGNDLLLITPERSYRGLLQDLFTAVEKEAAIHYHKPLRLEIADQRNERLKQFAAAASPALYEAARSGYYREAVAEISEIASAYDLTDFCLTVDSQHLYLQAGDGGSILYQIVPLPPLQEGETADA